MLYINIDTGHVSEKPITGYQSRHDWDTLADAEAAAAVAGNGEYYIAIDNGPHHWPRFDVIEKPRPGEPVSYAFNGDYYPCGHIKSVSKSLKVVTTTTGARFYRRKLTGCWRLHGTWTLVHGHIERQNPHF